MAYADDCTPKCRKKHCFLTGNIVGHNANLDNFQKSYKIYFLVTTQFPYKMIMIFVWKDNMRNFRLLNDENYFLEKCILLNLAPEEIIFKTLNASTNKKTK
jgi:hypothetical protein